MPAPRSFTPRSPAAAPARRRRRICRIFRLPVRQHGLAAGLIGAAAAALALPACAQVAGAVSLQSDYELRGYSLTARKPAAILDLSVDTGSGFYFNGSAIGDLDISDRPQLVGLMANGGYARRVTTRLSLDAGINHFEQFQRYGVHRELGYTEAYVGALFHGFSSHLYYSPDYYRPDVSTLYGEVDWGAGVAAQFHLSAHLGGLTYLSQPAVAARRDQYDWRLGVSHPIGPIDLSLNLTGGGPSPDPYDLSPHSKTALTAGASWTF